MKLTEKLNNKLQEAEMSSKPNPKLYNKVKAKLEKQKYNSDAEWHLQLLKGMNPKKLSQSDMDTLNDFDDMYEAKRVFSDFDRSLVLGNRDRVNSALQELDFAQRNIKNMERGGYDNELKKAIDLLIKYNKKVLKDLDSEK